MKLSLLLLLIATVTPEVRFLEGLRERRLYRLAEIECREQLAASNLSDPRRIDLVIQLALIHIDRALDAKSAERAVHWENALRVCDEHLERYPTMPRSLLIVLQRALVSIARGEVEQLEAIGTPDESQRLAAANEHLREAIRQLEKVRETIEAARNGLKPELLAEGGFGAEELDSLAGNVALETARALSRQAACFSQGSADRDDALLRAVGLLEPLAAKSPADDFVWRARLELLGGLRQLGRNDSAQEQLATWIATAPPEGLADSVFAERLRLLLAAERFDEALALAEQSPQHAAADADLARIETFVAVWRRQPEDRLVQSINSLLHRVRQQHGPAATRRAEAFVGRAFATSPSANNPEGLVAAAEHLFHAGKYDEALATYDRAAEAFLQSGKVEESFSTALTAATIDRERGNLASAADRYRKLALSQPQQKQAATAHQAAILSLADALRGDPAKHDNPAIALYEQMLKEHVSKWHDSPTADDARWWLAQFLARSGKTSESLAVLAVIPATSQYADEAVELAGQLYALLLAPLPRDSAEARETLVRATAHLQPLVLSANQQWPESWTPLQRAAALSLSQLHLKYGLQGHEYAQRMLLAALRGTPAAEPDWQSDAASLLIVALVRGGQTGQAMQWLQPTAGQRPSNALSLLDALLAELQRAAAAEKSALAGILLSAVDMTAARSKGDAEMEALLVRYRAAALAGLGRDQEALTLYQTLAPQKPRDGDLQEEYARLLAREDSTAAREQALRQWQAVERGCKQGSERWFRARLARIELLQALARHDEAAKLLALTRLVHPDLGGVEMRAKFEAL